MASARRNKSNVVTDRSNAAGNNRDNAPNGMDRAESVALASAVDHPAAAANTNTSRANRVFPTPTAPAITTPRAAPPRRHRSHRANSSRRPTNGHPDNTPVNHASNRLGRAKYCGFHANFK
jgi:hypothetical protein